MKSTAEGCQISNAMKSAAPPVKALLKETGLATFPHFPSADELNVIANTSSFNGVPTQFQGQSSFSEQDNRYYEEIIAATGRVPTREKCWHDLFNALIWIQFPQTKLLLNRLHMADIQEFGLHPRTARRNRLTHFDECGVVLAVPQQHLAIANWLLSQLATHQWETVFLDYREKWGTAILPFIFGHANLEMMLTPFDGLTGKWVAVKVANDFATLPVEIQRLRLDEALLKRVGQLDNFLLPHILRPLPLLGVPGWHDAQTPCYYKNKDYFRPQRPETPATEQLPLI
ncbi:DUF3025 domain-containing protein [Alteromonas pelagimontana]|uniref:DUF3025 domain-containing protein n=1 Tax=Alteromonas pelagimontana TaxID=1858656 RepID=A0A6M4M9R7_9ALTE|nr:DUF3025 domain-containing protein [Alteromonas pelagimontana]QJR79884.1 DUF3025 domain-containing protein [Alteromonas pelagimontana]